MNLTELEKKTMIEIGEIDGNGEYIINGMDHSQYLSILNISTPRKQLRGVLSSLVKKGLIKVKEAEESDDTIVEVTEIGLNYL